MSTERVALQRVRKSVQQLTVFCYRFGISETMSSTWMKFEQKTMKLQMGQGATRINFLSLAHVRIWNDSVFCKKSCVSILKRQGFNMLNPYTFRQVFTVFLTRIFFFPVVFCKDEGWTGNRMENSNILSKKLSVWTETKTENAFVPLGSKPKALTRNECTPDFCYLPAN